MKPSARRRVERQLIAIIERSGDNCSICGKTFPHNSRSYGGVTASGVPVVAGECCCQEIAEILFSGVYLDHSYDNLSSAQGQPADLSSSEIHAAITHLQQWITETDQVAKKVARKAGLSSGKPIVHTADSSWKRDDAMWFQNNPGRSHRLRPMLPGEEETLFKDASKATPPPRHEFQVVVRQVEPGTRIRVKFCRNLDTPIPDLEAPIHAVFDLVSGHTEGDGVISVKAVAELATRYSLPDDNGKTRN